jgi:hypothetical protein
MEIEIGGRLLAAVVVGLLAALVERWWHYASRRRL